MDTTARVNGRVRVLEAEEVQSLGVQAPEVSNPDKNAVLIQGILVDVDEAYLHCPRAFRFSKLWNPATIEENAVRSVKSFGSS